MITVLARTARFLRGFAAPVSRFIFALITHEPREKMASRFSQQADLFQLMPHLGYRTIRHAIQYVYFPQFMLPASF